MHCPSLSPPSKSDAYQVLNIFYKLSTHIYHHGAPDGLMPGLLPSSHTQTPPVTLEPSFCHIPPTFMRLQALHCVEHVGRGRTLSNPRGARGRGGPSAIVVEHVGHRGPLAIPREHVGHRGPSAIPMEHVGCRGPSAIPREHVGHGGPSAILVEHVGCGGPSAIPVEHMGHGGPSAIPVVHVGHGGPSPIPKLHLLFPLCQLPDMSSLWPRPRSSH